MAAEVVILEVHGKHRSHIICAALSLGIARAGGKPRLLNITQYRKGMAKDIVFYGFNSKLPEVMRDQISLGAVAVHVDLGYWGRHQGGRIAGYHKIAVNDKNPTKHFQNMKHSSDRFDKLGVVIKPWKNSGEHILLAGMSAKAAKVDGYGPEEWERGAVKQLQEHTSRKILYRPKPSWKEARPIEGTVFCDPMRPLTGVLSNAHAVVTHHSNAAVDALVEGVPVFCMAGVASVLGLADLPLIETPIRLEGREQWAADIAYTQWTVAELTSGRAWNHLKAEGLVGIG